MCATDSVVRTLVLSLREVAKHFKCPYMTGHCVTPDGAIVLSWQSM